MSQLVFCSNSFSHQTQLQVVVCVHNPTGGLLCVAGDSLWFCMCFGKIPVACCVLLVTRCGSVCVLARFSVYQLSLLPVACCVWLVTRCGSACSLTIVLEVGMVPCMQPHFRPGT